jgi:hypothetical protein
MKERKEKVTKEKVKLLLLRDLRAGSGLLAGALPIEDLSN